jgi:serine/threonine protein kinase
LTRFQADQLLRGRTKGFDLGKYRVLDRLGGGAMGTVYLCEHLQLRCPVAVKVISPQTVERDPTTLMRFHREARATAALNHPNIVRVTDIDQSGAHHFIVMEYLEGTTLQDLVRRDGPLPVAQAVGYVLQAALGLQHIHESGLVHRDLKPGNLLLDRQGTVKILDLGLAMFIDDRRDNLTATTKNHCILGTADYLSPEQAAASHDVDIRTDIYSLGATLYFLLAGKAPSAELSLNQKLLALYTGRPTPLTAHRPDLDPALAALVEKMMAKDAAERYQTPLQLAYALAAFLSAPVELPPVGADGMRVIPKSRVVKHPSKRSRPVPPLPPSTVSQPGSHWAETARWVRRRPRTSAALAAVAFLVVTLGVFLSPRPSAGGRPVSVAPTDPGSPSVATPAKQGTPVARN